MSTRYAGQWQATSSLLALHTRRATLTAKPSRQHEQQECEVVHRRHRRLRFDAEPPKNEPAVEGREDADGAVEYIEDTQS